MIQQQISLYYKEAGSDKVYHAQIVNDRGEEFVVNFQYGRRGSTLQSGTKTASPVTMDKAQKIFDKLVAEKKSKGYTEGEDGTPYAGTEKAGAVSGLVPQLLNFIDLGEAENLLSDPQWMAQPKMDGVRLMIQKQGNVITGSNRKGLVVAISAAIEAGLKQIPYDFIMDGEAIGDVYWAFDLLEFAGDDLREKGAEARFWDLHHIFESCGDADISLGDAVQFVPTAFTADGKRRLFAQIEEARGEGVVFKKVNAPYRPGRPNSGGSQLKHKFKETATCEVMERNQGKRSVKIGVRKGPIGVMTSVGNVTIPSNFDVPDEETLVDVEYLYAYPGGSLFQPVYKGVRTDKDAADTYDSLKLKQGTTEEDDA